MANIRMTPHVRNSVRDLQLSPGVLGVSDEAVVRALAMRFARNHLQLQDIRDVKLIAFTAEVTSNWLGGHRLAAQQGLIDTDQWRRRLGVLGGISPERVAVAVQRLIESGVLVAHDEQPMGLRFADQVLQPAGAVESVDWPAVCDRIGGRTPALLIFRAVLDRLRLPGQWTSLTYQSLAEHACYSVGMAQHGIAQLVTAGVLERTLHAGRGHDYRCSPWALGQVLGQVTDGVGGTASGAVNPPVYSPSPAAPVPATQPTAEVESVSRASSSKHVETGESSMILELGGLVMHLPAGTEIRVGTDATGTAYYDIGPHLRFKHRA